MASLRDVQEMSSTGLNRNRHVPSLAELDQKGKEKIEAYKRYPKQNTQKSVEQSVKPVDSQALFCIGSATDNPKSTPDFPQGQNEDGFPLQSRR